MTNVPLEETINRFTTVSGAISSYYVNELQNYNISNPNSEVILEHCIWDDYRKNEAYQNCVVKDSDYYLSVTNNYSFDDLKKAVKHFCEQDKSISNRYEWHLKQMEKNYKHMKTNALSLDEKKGCALVLSYYTGCKLNSDRSSRNVNALIRGENSFNKTEKWSDGKNYYVITYYLSKATSHLPFYWGNTVRCVQLTEKQVEVYKPGAIVTWLQWSSSKIGDKPAPYFEGRNTWFFIYSFSSRDISEFSKFSDEREALYSPFSHFLVFKKIKKGDKNLIYMRQIEIGLYINNIVWVDDNILNKNWENKGLMELAYAKNKKLKIIPKITTQTAMAFIKSFKTFIKSGQVKYKIMSDMTRYNEKPSDNAGARLVKYLQDNGFSGIEIMIFTSSKQKALNELRKLNVYMNNKIKITTSTSDAIQFLISD